MSPSREKQLQLIALSDELKYKAIVGKTSVYDGHFYYGVITTDIFCKPSCLSKTAKRENVRFFKDTKSAIQAGFRACLRCQPNKVADDEDEIVFHTYRNSSFGPLMVAATQQGICFAQFCEDHISLYEQLQKEFPRARLVESTDEEGLELSSWIDALCKHLRQHVPLPDLPLDLRGTAFQLKVWEYLLNMRENGPITYGELANGIGSPNAFRAAASACGANRVGVLVPCHRVIRSNGGLGGYRWGLEKKRLLLDMERNGLSLIA